MTKSQLIDHINQNHKAGLNGSNTSFSSINKSKEVWWFNIAVPKFNEDVHLLLSSSNYALWLHLPKGFVKQLAGSFKIRQDKDAVDLEISADKNFKYLKDIKSGGCGFDFTAFVKEKIVY
jgi:hypothetical protein